VTGPTQRPLPDNTQHSQEIEVRDTGGIRTHNPSDRRSRPNNARPPGPARDYQRCLLQSSISEPNLFIH